MTACVANPGTMPDAYCDQVPESLTFLDLGHFQELCARLNRSLVLCKGAQAPYRLKTEWAQESCNINVDGHPPYRLNDGLICNETQPAVSLITAQNEYIECVIKQ